MEMMSLKWYHPTSCLLFLILFFSNPPSTTGTSISGFINTGARMLNKARKAKQSKEFLHAHNLVRASSHVPPLTWNKTLARFADNWAKQRRSDCQMTHSDGYLYGENIHWHLHKKLWSPERVVMDWFEEKSYYDVETKTCAAGEECGHYTQLVWRNTTDVGCARAKCYNGLGYIVVCEYDPIGNYKGKSPFD